MPSWSLAYQRNPPIQLPAPETRCTTIADCTWRRCNSCLQLVESSGSLQQHKATGQSLALGDPASDLAPHQPATHPTLGHFGPWDLGSLSAKGDLLLNTQFNPLAHFVTLCVKSVQFNQFHSTSSACFKVNSKNGGSLGLRDVGHPHPATATATTTSTSTTAAINARHIRYVLFHFLFCWFNVFIAFCLIPIILILGPVCIIHHIPSHLLNSRSWPFRPS